MQIKIEHENVGKRADIVLSNALPNFTRSSLHYVFDNNLVKINGKVAKAGQKLKQSDLLEAETEELSKGPEKIKLPIIYEDEDVVVINKPAGILTHAKGGLNLEPSVASFINSKLTGFSNDNNRAGIVHRLDRGTSGVIITAKNEQSLKWLQKQFSQRKTKKTYIAVVHGVPVNSEAIIDAPIGRNPRKPQTFIVSQSGKSAQTAYRTLKSFTKSDKQYSLVEFKPVTGRTHQIRVHAAFIGNPIVGDHVYSKDKNMPLMLHAKMLEITLPNRDRKIFESELPSSFMDFMND